MKTEEKAGFSLHKLPNHLYSLCYLSLLLPATSQLSGDSRYIILGGRIIRSPNTTLLVLPLPAKREKGEGKKEQISFNCREDNEIIWGRGGRVRRGR